MSPANNLNGSGGTGGQAASGTRNMQKFLVRAVLSALILAVLAWRVKWNALADVISHMQLWWALVAFALLHVGQSFSSWRWQVIAVPLGFTESYARFRSLFYIGTFFNLFLPTSVGGDAVRAWKLAGTPPLSPPSKGGGGRVRRLAAFGSVIADRVAGVTAMLLLACLATFAPLGDLPGWVAWLPWLITLGLIVTFALLPFLARRINKFKLLLDGMGWSSGHRSTWWKAVGISFIVQGLATLQVILLGMALDLPVPWLGYFVVVPLVTLLTMLPLSLNGFGLREGSLVLLLASYGVTQEQAVTLGLGWFALGLSVGLIGGIIYLFFDQVAPLSTEEKESNSSLSAVRREVRDEESTRFLSRDIEQIMERNPMDLSIVVPMKDERDNVKPLHQALCTALEPTGYSFEMILVDDGSIDGTFEALAEIARADQRVKVVQLRRNYGQTPALRAGIDSAQGDVIITMDGDLQNDPSDIPMLLEKLGEGYDVVLGERVKRQDKLILRKIPSWAANALIRKVTGTKIRDLGCTLRAMRREAAVELPLYGEMHRFISVLAEISGQRICQVPVKHHPRQFGKTKYNLSRTIRVFLDLITVRFLQSYLTRPMHAFGLSGLACFGISILSLLTCGFERIVWGEHMNRNPLLLLSVLLTVVGVQFISLGLIGEVLSRTYFESQGKTAYHIRRTINLDNDVLDATLNLGRRKVA